MFSILIKRFFFSLVTLVCILLITFLLLHCVPGGPFDQERALPTEIENNLYKKYGLTPKGDSSFLIWFLKDVQSYASYLIKGQLGPSLKYRDRDVGDIIFHAVGPSIQLGAIALSMALVLGVGLGLFQVGFKSLAMNKITQSLSTLFISLPSFVIAVLLVLLFSLRLKLLPPALWESPAHRILPSITLALAPLAYFFQLTLTGMGTIMTMDYMRTAVAKGVSQPVLLLKHGFKNVASPLLSTLGPMATYLITGSFVVETLFAIPGLGKHFVTAVIDRDYFLVMGITLLYAVILIVLNWITDLIHLWIDPRVRE